MVTKRAILDWIPAELGGRRSGPPEGEGYEPYAPVIRLLSTGEPAPPQNAWRVVVQKIEALEQPLRWLVEVNYLFDAAPHHLLAEGAEFELYEGKRCVARGRIVD